jgi:putative phosphoesterase
MRVLVVSDIHGNLAALEAVLATPHEALLCLGDLVGYGPEPAACVHRIRAEGGIVVQGNHDRAIADAVDPRCRAQFRWLADAVAPLTRSQLSGADITYLSGLPHWTVPEVDGVSLFCVHATPKDPLYRYLGPEPDEWQWEAAGVTADIVLVGHTHIQFDLDAGGRRVVNPGSVGQPKDGDPRAAYAVIEDGKVTLERALYPIERTVDALRLARLPEAAVADLSVLLRTGRAPVQRACV